MATYLALLLLLLLSGWSEWLALRLPEQWYLRIPIFTALLVALFAIPGTIYAYARYRMSRREGMTDRPPGKWALDQSKQLLLIAVFAIVGSEILFLLISVTAVWWLIGSAALIAASILYSLFLPMMIVRVFYRVRPLEDKGLSEGIRRLAEKSGIRRYRVYVINESGKSRGVNAFVTGLGRTKIIVLFDNLLKGFSRQEIESVVAHELGHCANHDTYTSLLIEGASFLVIAYILSLVLRALLSAHLVYATTDPNVLPWFALVAFIYEFATSPLFNLLSRRREARADMFALKVSGDPVAFVSGEKRMCDINMMEEDIPRWRKILFATHPTTLERVRMGEEQMRGIS